jgi:hypothetical protein
MLHKNFINKTRAISHHTHLHTRTHKVTPYFSRENNQSLLSVEKEEQFVSARRERERDARGRLDFVVF